MHLADGSVAENAESRVIEDERKDFNREGQKETGFASSVVPTLEEKIVSEQRLSKDQTDNINDGSNTDQKPEDGTGNEHARSGGTPKSLNFERRSISTPPFGAPANANPPNLDNPPARPLKSDVDEEEKAAPAARSIIRETLGSKSGKHNPWTVPTKKPQVGPNDFEDPISDAFWKDIWVASAVHNVSETLFVQILFSYTMIMLV